MSDFGIQQLFNEKNYMVPNAQAAERWGLEQLAKQEELRKAQLENEQSVLMNPLKVQSQVLQNEGTGYTNRKLATEATTGEQTMPGKIAATNSENELKVLGDKLKSYDTSIQMLDNIVPILQNTPPAMRHSVLIESARRIGLDPNDQRLAPMMQQLGQIDPAQLPQALGAFRERLITQSASYRQAMDVAKFNRESAEREGRANRQNAKDVMQMQIDAGRFNKGGSKSIAEQLSKMKVKERIGSIEGLLAQDDAQTDEEKKLSSIERAGLEAMLNQDRTTLAAELQTRPNAGGIQAQVGDTGVKLENRPPINLGGKPGANAPRRPLSQY